jgi:demethylmenaquinone methyltransferase/2-methoxy-6-polyprenyl-1,4-benzoquinol methylase
VDAALAPGGRVFFVDDAYRTPDELIEGEASSTIRRRLEDGTPYRAVKVPHEPAKLEARLAALGWRIRVRRTPGPFFWGEGTRC